jgi:hypothetical protein
VGGTAQFVHYPEENANYSIPEKQQNTQQARDSGRYTHHLVRTAVQT